MIDLNDTIKKQPSAIELEEAVLCAILAPFGEGLPKQQSILATVLPQLKPEHFYDSDYREIYRAIVEMDGAESKIDPLTIVQYLKQKGMEFKQGNVFYVVANIIGKVTTNVHADYHCKIILQQYLLREITRITTEMNYKIADGTIDAFEAQGQLVKQIEDIKIMQGVNVKEFDKHAVEIIKELQDRHDTSEGVEGIGIEYPSLAKNIQTMKPGNYILIGARPGVGKTSFGLNVARRVAQKHTPVLFFSIEMMADEISGRLISNISEVFNYAIHNKMVNQNQLDRIAEKKYNLPIIIDDTPSLTIAQFKARSRDYVRRMGVKIIIIDYIQLMKSGMKHNTKEEEIAEVSKAIKAIAKELGVVVIPLAQLNRDSENKPPTMANLRGSGQLEQDSDIVLLMWSPTVASKDATVVDVEIIVDKNRHGSKDTHVLKFNLDKQKFIDPED